MNASPTPGSRTTIATPSHDEIALCARALWAESGQPEGRDDAIWLEAENRLLSAHRAPDVTAVMLATLSQPVTRQPAVASAMAPTGRRRR